MLKNLVIISFILVFSTFTYAQKAKPKTPQLPADIAKWVGEDVDKILENAHLKDRLKKLLGEKNYATFTEYFETSKPIEKDGKFLFSSGCMIRACTHLESAIAIDSVNNTVHAAIFNEIEETKYFNENNSKTPESIINWAKHLENSKTNENQAKAVLFDEFRYLNSEDFMARFDNYVIQFQNQPNDNGYIVISGKKNSRSSVETEIKEYVKLRGLDIKRLVFKNGDGDSKVSIQLWIVPEGAEPPDTKDEKVQANSDNPMKKEALAALIAELKEVVSKITPDKNEAKLVATRWDKRGDLSGRTKSEVIGLLYEDVKAVIKDSGTQYQIYSIFSFYKKMPVESPSAETQIIALEKQAWEEWKNGNKKFVENFVADDVFYVYPEGVLNKSQIVEGVGSCKFNSYSLEDFKFKMLDKNSALVSYIANQDIVCNGNPAPKKIRSTSVYVKQNGKWLSTFYTETAEVK